MSYRNLDVWNEARDIIIMIHKMSLSLPVHEKYEVGSQIRRSSKSIKANIVEGYGRRNYKNEFAKFIIYAIASTDETIDHLETLIDTGSLSNSDEIIVLNAKLNILGRKLIKFLNAIESKHISPK